MSWRDALGNRREEDEDYDSVQDRTSSRAKTGGSYLLLTLSFTYFKTTRNYKTRYGAGSRADSLREFAVRLSNSFKSE